MPETPKAYDPQSVETKWYSFWEENVVLQRNPGACAIRVRRIRLLSHPQCHWCVTHGACVKNTIQDILARKARMDGKEVLWLPGTDHAGIATQNVVERALRRRVDETSDDLGRERLLEHIWKWKEKHGGIIIEQLKRLGASCDWSRLRFTMDEEYTKCVQRVLWIFTRKSSFIAVNGW
ncbi:MAG: hypothetical protein Ct9H300mP7_4820 [Verrucomicrobiota bacterium]|nr:MAG: hypothetical protein Ct9H300mP7_4820 [Verrucomicrobiota bacterium]